MMTRYLLTVSLRPNMLEMALILYQTFPKSPMLATIVVCCIPEFVIRSSGVPDGLISLTSSEFEMMIIVKPESKMIDPLSL